MGSSTRSEDIAVFIRALKNFSNYNPDSGWDYIERAIQEEVLYNVRERVLNNGDLACDFLLCEMSQEDAFFPEYFLIHLIRHYQPDTRSLWSSVLKDIISFCLRRQYVLLMHEACTILKCVATKNDFELWTNLPCERENDKKYIVTFFRLMTLNSFTLRRLSHIYEVCLRKNTFFLDFLLDEHLPHNYNDDLSPTVRAGLIGKAELVNKFSTKCDFISASEVESALGALRVHHFKANGGRISQDLESGPYSFGLQCPRSRGIVHDGVLQKNVALDYIEHIIGILESNGEDVCRKYLLESEEDWLLSEITSNIHLLELLALRLKFKKDFTRQVLFEYLLTFRWSSETRVFKEREEYYLFFIFAKGTKPPPGRQICFQNLRKNLLDIFCNQITPFKSELRSSDMLTVAIQFIEASMDRSLGMFRFIHDSVLRCELTDMRAKPKKENEEGLTLFQRLRAMRNWESAFGKWHLDELDGTLQKKFPELCSGRSGKSLSNVVEQFLNQDIERESD